MKRMMATALIAACACQAPPPEPPAPAKGPVLLFGGDTNLGRRQNAISAHRGFDEALGALAPSFEAADLVALNLESVISGVGELGVEKGEDGPFYYRGRPEQVRVLLEAGVKVAGTANNHAGDYGPDALLDQGRLLAMAGIAGPGTGADRDGACAPRYQAAADLVVAFISVDATQEHFAATETSPGTCYLPPGDPDAWRSTLEPRIQEARERAHLVFLMPHWGKNNREKPEPWIRDAARATMELGLDGILGTSSHLLHGVEVVEGRPVVYDAGNLLFDSHMEGGYTRSALFQLVLGPSGVRQVRATPVTVGYGRTVPAADSTRELILETFRTRSAALGTEVRIWEGAAWLDLPESPERPPPRLRPPDLAAQGEPPSPLTEPPTGCVVPAVPPDAVVEPMAHGPLRLLGMKVHNPEIEGRSMLKVESWWEATEVPRRDCWIYQRVVPVSGDRDHMWWGDHEPCDWAWPTTRWRPGVIYRDEYLVRPPHPLPPGDYTLVMGVRDPSRPLGQDSVRGKVTVSPRP